MADLTITAASVLAASGASTVERTAGGAVTRGQPVYVDTSDSNEVKAAVATAQASSKALGIALNDAADGQPVSVCTGGGIDVGATLTVGEVYVVSATAGGIAPAGDLVSTNYVSVLGVATTASNLNLVINNSEVAKP